MMQKSIPQNTAIAIPLNKEEFLALQVELEGLELSIAKGEETPEDTLRMVIINLQMDSAPWDLHPDHGCTSRMMPDPLTIVIEHALTTLKESGFEPDGESIHEVIEDAARDLGIKINEAALIVAGDAALDQLKPDTIEACIDAATQHGQDDMPDHEVGDLQEYLRELWALLTPAQKGQFMALDSVRDRVSETLGTEFDEAMDGYQSVVPTMPQQALPFGIEITSGGAGNARITSRLADEFKEDGKLDATGKAASDSIESFLVAMACEGIDLHDTRILAALETSVEAIANNLDQEVQSDIHDVADHVLKMQEKYGFKNDEESVRSAVEESIGLLNIQLSESSIVAACDAVLEQQALNNDAGHSPTA